jgi:hypothetical protein
LARLTHESKLSRKGITSSPFFQQLASENRGITTNATGRGSLLSCMDTEEDVLCADLHPPFLCQGFKVSSSNISLQFPQYSSIYSSITHAFTGSMRFSIWNLFGQRSGVQNPLGTKRGTIWGHPSQILALHSTHPHTHMT